MSNSIVDPLEYPEIYRDSYENNNYKKEWKKIVEILHSENYSKEIVTYYCFLLIMANDGVLTSLDILSLNELSKAPERETAKIIIDLNDKRLREKEELTLETQEELNNKFLKLSESGHDFYVNKSMSYSCSLDDMCCD